LSNYITKKRAAFIVRRSERTIENWVGAGYITGYRDGAGQILVDLDEIEAAFKSNRQMRDGRRPYGHRARIVPLPVQPVIFNDAGGVDR
jgi:hypothetical protein